MSDLAMEYVHELAGMLNVHLLQGREALLARGRCEFLALSPQAQEMEMRLGAAAVRIAVGLRLHAETLPSVFRSEGNDPVELFLAADLLARLPGALATLRLPPPPSGCTRMNDIAVFRVLHMALSVAEEAQRCTPPRDR